MVTETGIRTFFGRASELMNEVDKKRNSSMMGSGGHFQQLVTKLTMGLLCMSLTLVIILAIRLFAIGEQSALDIISTGVVLLVASIPIAMQVGLWCCSWRAFPSQVGLCGLCVANVPVCVLLWSHLWVCVHAVANVPVGDLE